MLSHERYCFGEFTLLGSQQDVFLWFGNNGKRCYSLIRKKKNRIRRRKTQNYLSIFYEHKIVLVSRKLMLVQ